MKLFLVLQYLKHLLSTLLMSSYNLTIFNSTKPQIFLFTSHYELKYIDGSKEFSKTKLATLTK